MTMLVGASALVTEMLPERHRREHGVGEHRLSSLLEISSVLAVVSTVEPRSIKVPAVCCLMVRVFVPAVPAFTVAVLATAKLSVVIERLLVPAEGSSHCSTGGRRRRPCRFPRCPGSKLATPRT